MKLQQTKDYLLLIDEEAETCEYYLHNSIDGRHQIYSFKDNEDNFKRGQPIQWCSKILAYYPLTKEAKELDLPLLPEWNKEKYSVEEKLKLAKQAHNFNHKMIDEISFSVGFIVGYDKAQEKQFTIEDIENAFEAGWQCKVNNGYKLDGTYYDDLYRHTQSLSTQQLPKEFIISEMEYLQPNIGHRESWATVKLPLIKEFANSAILRYKTILNSEDRKVLVGKYKY